MENIADRIKIVLDYIKAGKFGSGKTEHVFKTAFPELYREITAYTIFLDREYDHVQFRSRLTCILNAVDGIRECLNPNCRNKVDFSKLRPDQPMPKYCCVKCAQSDPRTTACKKRTKAERYGDPDYCNKEAASRTVAAKAIKDPQYYQHIVEKRKSTAQERHGSETYCNSWKSRQTKAEKYGNPNFSNREKAAATWRAKSELEKADIQRKRLATIERLEKQNPGYKAGIRQKALKTGAARHGEGNSTNHIKCAETVRKRYGVDNVFQREDIKAAAKVRNMSKYGVEYYSSTPECKEKVEATCRERYGVQNVFQSLEIRQKIKDENIRSYGVEYNWQREDVKAAARKTNLQRYGCEYACQNSDIRRKMSAGYIVYCIGTNKGIGYFNAIEYAGFLSSQPEDQEGPYVEKIDFDSAPELAYYVWLTDSGIDFEYKPDMYFEYEYGGKSHRYFPDFMVEGEFIELKGDHFFDESGKMRNPFRDPRWTDQEYLDECRKYETKHQCMLVNGVKILRESQYAKYIKYAEDKYGEGFLRKFKKSAGEAS